MLQKLCLRDNLFGHSARRKPAGSFPTISVVPEQFLSTNAGIAILPQTVPRVLGALVQLSLCLGRKCRKSGPP